MGLMWRQLLKTTLNSGRMKQPPPPKLNDCDRVLIVEGESDLQFYKAALTHLGLAEGVFIKVFKGRGEILKKDTLETFLSPILLEKQSVGILLDGDDKPAGAVQSLSGSLKQITGQDVKEGQWTSGEPRLGMMVVPDLQTKGEIETLVWNTWAETPANQAVAQTVLTYLSEMENHGIKAKSPDKARIGAYLAAAYDEDPRLGAGAREGLFDFNAPGFTRLMTFLSELKPR